MNGKERDMRKFKKISCYIMQEDVLQKQLSVAEIMMLAANLKLGRNFSTSEKQQIVGLADIRPFELFSYPDCR